MSPLLDKLHPQISSMFLRKNKNLQKNAELSMCIMWKKLLDYAEISTIHKAKVDSFAMCKMYHKHINRKHISRLKKSVACTQVFTICRVATHQKL